MNIAILGWGSLIWDDHPEFDTHRESWLPDGPNLPLEFSRISSSRLGALTLVIDENYGDICRVAYTMSKRQNPDDAICDLRCREGTTHNNIGYYYADHSRSGRPIIPDGIKLWAQQKKIDVVVWAGLASNFETKCGIPFSVEAALSYLKNLSPEGKAKAAEYIFRAPDFVRTSLRSSVEIAPWFPARE